MIKSTADHQSATKSASVLQIYKKLPTSDTAKIRTAFLILRKKKLLIFLTMLTEIDSSLRLTNNFPFTYRHRKKEIKAWKTECEDRRVAG